MKPQAIRKRFHVHVGVRDLEASIRFYSTLFGQAPAKRKADYAKWMLEDPRLNFAISTRVSTEGVDHLGFQVEDDADLEAVSQRLKSAQMDVLELGATTCCYAESKKTWVTDPSGIAWETYRTMGDAEVFHKAAPSNDAEVTQASCVPSAGGCC